MHALQERLYSWLGGLRASDVCGGLIHKLSESGLASQQRMKLEALRVSAFSSGQSPCVACHRHPVDIVCDSTADWS